MSHRNWFLIIVEKYIISISWLTIIVSATMTSATYLIDPIYSVKTELSLDASIEKILPDISGIPSTKASDYIRFEYFAINSVNQMQKPEIGNKIIEDFSLKNNNNKLSVDNFINPSIFNLLFSNDGHGITVKWISDTQQFSITGYGKDIDTASLLSSKYADAFLAYDKKQFKETLQNIKKRQADILNSAANKRLAVEKEQIALRQEYGVADWAERLQSLTTSLASVEQEIFSEEIAQSTNKLRMKELEKQVKELKTPLHITISEKKSDILSGLQTSLTTLTLKLTEIAVEFTPQHPEYKKIQDQIDSLKNQIAKEAKQEYSQSSHATSDALDTVLTNMMDAREKQVVRTATLDALTALKKQYIKDLNFVGEGNAFHINLEEKKSGLINVIKTAEENIIEIEALMQQPFSFFRVVGKTFVDTNHIKDSIYLPRRKLTLIISFACAFLLSLFYFVIREIHLETLFYAWQLQGLSDGVESIDVVYNRKKNNLSLPSRQIFHSANDTGKIIRIRKLDSKSHPDAIAKLGAEYYFHSGEPTLLVNNRKGQLSLECPEGRGLHSWLTGRQEEITDGIKSHGTGYDILCDTLWNIDEPWVKTMNDIRILFSTLAQHYSNIILLDPSLRSNRRLPGDAIIPDIDILTVTGGSLSVGEVLEIIQHEKLTFKGERTIILVINNKKSINIFSIKGCCQLLIRFFKAPFDILTRN